ncbi:haloacid dehalogenase superfamily, subfamily IA, variant 3 with third motif having DD or ED/haloacid dehalogenase superfamily, subfamily IA, variant 1 with third motif having Dx(3-4)D or Dx(3-4)E [Succinivibrio dextrinosolvens]|uniref:HAD family hydrolase n=1 Tax=Succinivibrio dextrinosolvens TaxID=83771 RepID=UPI0008E6FD52|nr:HAD family phosphatase [Succinivibrio dextrinosolvens]SFS83271.1 haloacid dehalogenase superfamily, subfamily IA, variant 3 with third motif having DD or ED/haloacid dehalogenase superfamily, subfamily IA, variant 1 with third motif having Dx(3-4)D or Dx(3-4)E [Succinivibrio dextrinosolvens]
MSRIKAILFDMDGVLIDAKEWHYEALNKALGLFGLEISMYDHLTSFDGLPTKVKLQKLSKRFFLPESLHSFVNKMKQIYTVELIHERCHPMFHHEYALSKLHQEGYKLAVCSNSIRNTIELMMDKAELSSYLDLIVSNEDVKNAKPDPEMYLTAMNKLGVSPSECIVVEDNYNGILAGRASGASVLEVATVYDVTYENIMQLVRNNEND